MARVARRPLTSQSGARRVRASRGSRSFCHPVRARAEMPWCLVPYLSAFGVTLGRASFALSVLRGLAVVFLQLNDRFGAVAATAVGFSDIFGRPEIMGKWSVRS